MKTRNPVARRRQRGHLILEFGLVAIMFVPLTVGMFITGINMVRSIQANYAARCLADMYIHGADFSDLGMQQIAKRLAGSLNLQVGESTGNNNNNVSNGGAGIVWITKLQWIGDSSSPSCLAVTGTCANASKFVVLEQVRFGNGTLAGYKESTAGALRPNRDTLGRVTDDAVKSSNSRVPEPQQTALYNLWQGANPANRTPLQDGQVIYMAEVYFRHTGGLAGNGVYSRWFF